MNLPFALCLGLALWQGAAAAAGMPEPDGRWRIAGLDFGVRHLAEKSALCSSHRIHTYSMADVPSQALGSTYRGVSSRIRLMCRIDPARPLSIPVEYRVDGELVSTFTVLDDPRASPFPQIAGLTPVNETAGGSDLFRSYWDAYGDPDFVLPRRHGETLPEWARADYLYALAVDRSMGKGGVFDVHFDARFESGPLDVVDPAALSESLALDHPLALTMSMLDYFPYAGADEDDIEAYWRSALEEGLDEQRLTRDIARLVDAGLLQGDILSRFLSGDEDTGFGVDPSASGERSNSGAASPASAPLDADTAYRAILDYFSVSDCDAFPRIFFDNPQNDRPDRIALAAELYRFVDGGCGVGIRNAEIVIEATSAELTGCAERDGRQRCEVVTQYRCDAVGTMRGSSLARLACLDYSHLIADSTATWAYELDEQSGRWSAEFIGR